jgi:nucleotide-binding universal stress UspA family protein
MGWLGRILVPVEFSERCAGAARYACTLAEEFGSELIMLHVLLPRPPEMAERVYEQAAAEVTGKLKAFLGEELPDGGIRRLVIKGDPARKIVQYARDERVDVIVMATHGFGPFRQFILGSNTAKVLHDADCPVWTGVHMDEASQPTSIPFRRIVCAVDLGPQSAHALGWATTLQRECDAELTLVHAAMAAPAVVKAPEANWTTVMREAAEQELEQLRRNASVRAGLIVENGDPAEVIAAAADRLRADVVVIGRGSAAGAFGRLRANAYAIIRQSPCPVVSV